jgi:hypothetical protein
VAAIVSSVHAFESFRTVVANDSLISLATLDAIWALDAVCAIDAVRPIGARRPLCSILSIVAFRAIGPFGEFASVCRTGSLRSMSAIVM